MKTAVVLLSGGLDSSTVLFYAKRKGYDCHCLIFDYGQRHKKELRSAVKLARLSKSPYQILKINFPWKAGSLLDRQSKIPVFYPSEASAKEGRLPSTYVPGRNTIFISFALSYAEAIKAGTVFIGANAVDYSGYPDCRPGYYKAFNKVLTALGTGVKIQTPLIDLTKEAIIKLGMKLGVPYEFTWSCYKGGSKPCCVCDSCRFRAKGFIKARSVDPALHSLNK